MARTGQDHPLVVIKQNHPCYVSFTVPEREAERIRLHQSKHGPLMVRAAPPDTRWPIENGQPSFIDSKVDKGSGTILLKRTLSKPAARLQPGQL